MSEGFKEMLDFAITRNIREIQQPIEIEIRRILKETIEELNLVKKSDFEELIRDTFKKLLSERKDALISLIIESLTKEFTKETKGFDRDLKESEMTLQDELKIDSNSLTPVKKDSMSPYEPIQEPEVEEPQKNIKEFINSREFASRNQQFRGVAYYLTKIAKIDHFNIKDLREAFKEANLKAHPNFGITARDNVKSGFFATVPGKKDGYVKWKITEKTIKEFK